MPPEASSGLNSVAVLLPLALFAFPAIEGLPFWAVGVVVVVVALCCCACTPVELRQPSEQGHPARRAEAGELVELRTDSGLHFVAMQARFGEWPEDAAQALVGQVVGLPAAALRRKLAVKGTVVVRRQELRQMGVRRWDGVVHAVANMGAQALLIVNVGEELEPLSLSEGTTTHLPTALMRHSDGEKLLAAVGRGRVRLRTRSPSEAAVSRAEELSFAERHAEAAEALGEALQGVESPEEALPLHIRRSDALRLAGKAQEATLDALAAVRLDPESADGWLAVVRAHRASGEAEQARKAAEQAVDLYEINDERLTALVHELTRPPEELARERKEIGNVLFKQHRYAEAKAAYTSALDVLPSSEHSDTLLRAACFGNRAGCSQQLHEWEAVISDGTQALALQPDNVKVRLRRAIAFEALECHGRALQDAREILSLDHRHAQANSIQHRAGKALRDLGMPDPGKQETAVEVSQSRSSDHVQQRVSSASVHAVGPESFQLSEGTQASSCSGQSPRPAEPRRSGQRCRETQLQMAQDFCRRFQLRAA